MEHRALTIETKFETREDNENPVIEGYFAVFNSDYHITSGMSESIAPGAFRNALNADIRALIDHDPRLVLGRTFAHTLELREDDHGLWGRIHINTKDTDAMNLYERVKRGDVSQCSFGFKVLDEEVSHHNANSAHWTIKEVKLYEVSCVTFPAYEETSINARKQDYANIQQRKLDCWREDMHNRLKGVKPC